MSRLSRTFPPHCWLFMSLPSGYETPLVVLSCSHTQADGFALCPHSPPRTSLHPLLFWDTTWVEKTRMEGTHLAPSLTTVPILRVPLLRCLTSLRVTKFVSLLPPSPGRSGRQRIWVCGAAVPAANGRGQAVAALRARWKLLQQQQQGMLSLCHRSALPSLSPPSHQSPLVPRSVSLLSPLPSS